MATQVLDFTKVSELIETQTINNDSVFIVNVNNVTYKIKYITLLNAISAVISGDVTQLAQRVTALETASTAMASDISDLNGTVNNIITAGFNLIGIDTPAQGGA